MRPIDISPILQTAALCDQRRRTPSYRGLEGGAIVGTRHAGELPKPRLGINRSVPFKTIRSPIADLCLFGSSVERGYCVFAALGGL